MSTAPIPQNEAQRLAALRRFDILDSAAEEAYDALTQLAAKIAGTPISLVSLIDEHRQWFKSNVGLPEVTQTPRDMAFCAHAIMETSMFEVHDAQADPRFSDNPLVRKNPRIRFYAGVPLITQDGDALGTLCVIDQKPRSLNADQREQLQLLARAVTDLIESRARLPRLERERLLALSVAMDNAADMVIVGDATTPPAGWPKIVAVNKEALRELGYQEDELIGRDTGLLFAPDADPAIVAAISDALARHEPYASEFVGVRKDGSRLILEVRSRPVFDENGVYTNRVVFVRNISELKTMISQLNTLSMAIEQSNEGIAMYRTSDPALRDMEMLYVNKALERHTGYSRDELFAGSADMLFGPRTEIPDPEQTAKRLCAGEPVSSELLLYRKDGSTYWAEMTTQPVFDTNGKIEQFLTTERDITQRKANESELQTLRALIDEATDFIFTTDATPPSQGGPFFTYANQALLNATGYSEEEVIGRPPAMFWGPKTERGVIKTLIERISRGDPAGYEFLSYRKDGSQFWVEFNGRPILDKETGLPRHWIAVGRDVSKRRETEQQLRVLQAAISRANDAIVVYEIDPTQRTKPKVLFVNEATIESSGFSREELMNGPTGTGPETDRAELARFRHELISGRPARTRLRLYRKDGSTYWGEINAQPIKNTRGEVTHLVSIERDVSDTVAREKQLESDNQTLSSLMQVSRELFGLVSSELLRAKLLSGIQTLTGLKPIEHVGVVALADPFLQRAANSRVPVVDRARDRTAFTVPATSAAPAAVIEIRAAAGEKLERATVLALQLFVQNYRTAAQNTALYEEIEDRRAAVIELNQTKSDLIAMLAHDFRGPLTTIMGFAELLRNESLEKEEAQNFLDTIISATERLTSLAGDTLSMSRLEENELTIEIEAVDYVALAQEAASMYRDEREIVIDAPGPIEALADRERMRQVFDNLIGNAVKYSPAGGDVTVSLREVNGAVVVRVTDTGIGIPEAELDRVFSRFSRASNARSSGIGGTGFGLYLTKQIVERHGGSVQVESVLDRGSTFIVTVPIAAGAGENPLRVLVGDRAGNIRSFTAHTLRTNGLVVKVCDTWRELEAELLEHSFDVAVVDVETFRATPTAIQQLLDASNVGSLPMIVIGAHRVEQLEGYAAMLRKPYLAADLLATVQRFDTRAARFTQARSTPAPHT